MTEFAQRLALHKSEEVARKLAERLEQRPVYAYELQQAQPRIAAPQSFSSDDDSDDDDNQSDERDDEFEDEEQRW